MYARPLVLVPLLQIGNQAIDVDDGPDGKHLQVVYVQLRCERSDRDAVACEWDKRAGGVLLLFGECACVAVAGGRCDLGASGMRKAQLEQLATAAGV